MKIIIRNIIKMWENIKGKQKKLNWIVCFSKLEYKVLEAVIVLSLPYL